MIIYFPPLLVIRVLDLVQLFIINLLWWWLDAAIDEGNEATTLDIVAHSYFPIV
ncbi:hypothetical protein Hanom_Chr09g00862781 [Helianthus anomalus]